MKKTDVFFACDVIISTNVFEPFGSDENKHFCVWLEPLCAGYAFMTLRIVWLTLRSYLHVFSVNSCGCYARTTMFTLPIKNSIYCDAATARVCLELMGKRRRSSLWCLLTLIAI